MKKLNWKKKYLGDKSGFWYSAKIKTLNWEYTVDNIYDTDSYECYLFVNTFSDEVKISKKKYKTVEAAQEFCQKHIEAIATKLPKEILK
jgi:hypothetical protein